MYRVMFIKDSNTKDTEAELKSDPSPTHTDTH